MEAAIALNDLVGSANNRFLEQLAKHSLSIQPGQLDTLQVNLTKLCNQACKHCHVDASPARTEMLAPENVERLLHVLHQHPQILRLDLTGGAPELHPQFDSLVERAVAQGKHVMVRHNLTVQLDGHPVSGESKQYLPDFFAKHGVELISSLPCYEEKNTDTQRGKGVYQKSIDALQRLNAVGYGLPNTGLVLNLVFNPQGTALPPPQDRLEADFRERLHGDYGISFNHLFTITNMPIHRFAGHLRKRGQFDEYMQILTHAFNPHAVESVMCKNLISIDHRGRLYDCDFNQQIGLPAISPSDSPMTLATFDLNAIQAHEICLADHCLGCTAGAGSSCGGALVP